MSTNKVGVKNENDVINFYEVIPKDLLNQSKNPRFKFHGLKSIYRGLLIGPSGSGKTNTLLNLIHAYRGTYDKIILCSVNTDEPLYNFLKERLGEDLEVFEGLNQLPELEDFKALYGPKSQILLIFDDLVLSDPKQMKKIENCYIRARKICGGVATIFLSQSYFKIPKIIRSNANYCFVKKVTSKKDLKLILNEFNLKQDIKELVEIYEKTTKDITDFLLVDVDAPIDKRLRHNFDVIE